MITGIHHIALKVADFDRAMRFYCDTLGLRFIRSWGDETKKAAMLDTGAGIIELFSGGAADAPEGLFIHLALSSDDVDGDYQRALAGGATTHKKPMDCAVKSSSGMDMNVRLAFVVSPTGEIVEFLKMIS